MPKGIYPIPYPENEPVKSFEPGSPERLALQNAVKEMRSKEIEIPMYIGNEEVRTGNLERLFPPYEIAHTLGHFHVGEKKHITQAIDAALEAREKWTALPWEHRASIFLKAAELLAGPYRAKINAATMLAQSKNAYQAEIDAACELIDFLRFNVYYMQEIYAQQPDSSPGIWNRLEYRPLEGFVFALTPFNFTAIAGNLPSSMAMMGNVVVWKPAQTQIYSAQVIMEVFKEAGVPDGVINLIYTDGPETSEVVFDHPDFAGLHFTGSTGVFQTLWKNIGANIEKFRTYPKIVGETGGKGFMMVHPSSDVDQVVTAIIRGGFEFQGQKCSAASRIYIPTNLWKETREKLERDLTKIKMGSPEDYTNFVNAVISERAFDKITSYIDEAKADGHEVLGGSYDKSIGYFIEPTIIITKDPKARAMREEIFGPVVTIYVYDENKWDETLELLDTTSPYALTGAIFSKDRYAIDQATKRLNNAAGNFYINDKPTGAVVGQQPFGGARGSGTNDKAGSYLNLIRWVSPRTIKENFNAPKRFEYPFLQED